MAFHETDGSERKSAKTISLNAAAPPSPERVGALMSGFPFSDHYLSQHMSCHNARTPQAAYAVLRRIKLKYERRKPQTMAFQLLRMMSTNTFVGVSSGIRIGGAFVPPFHISCKSKARRGASCTMVNLNKTKKDFYAVLGVRRGATREEIKSAYRRLARLLHPDASPAPKELQNPQRFINLHEAYSVLYDPDTRAEYDLRLATSAARSEFGSAMCVRRCSRNWENDQCW